MANIILDLLLNKYVLLAAFLLIVYFTGGFSAIENNPIIWIVGILGFVALSIMGRK